MSKRVFALDAGHGGKDSGAVGNGLQEKDIVLEVVKLAKSYIERNYNVDCRLTRSTDVFIPLAQRTSMTQSWGSECLVSVHVNSAANVQANGFESFVYTTDGPNSKSVRLQNAVHDKLAELWVNAGRRDRQKKKANFHMVREFKGAAVLVELGFIVNSKDAALLKDQQFLKANAEALADGIAEYMGLDKKLRTKERVYSFAVDGKQIGAYAVPGNIVRQLEAAIESGKESIEIKLVK